MRSVETFKLRVKLFNLQGRIWEKYIEIRWLGEVELTFNPSFYPSLVRMPMARRQTPTHDIAQSGEVFSKAPELAKSFLKGRGPRCCSATFDPISLSCSV
jgi:hypothetical protein